MFGVAHSLPEIGLSLKPKHHRKAKLVQIPYTHGSSTSNITEMIKNIKQKFGDIVWTGPKQFNLQKSYHDPMSNKKRT